MEETLIYYSIHIRMNRPAPSMMHYQEQHNDLFLSVHGKLSGVGAHLESEGLAQEFLSAYMPRLVKRYGDDVKAQTIKCTSRGSVSINKRTQAKIDSDSALARKRIETGILASNRRPE